MSLTTSRKPSAGQRRRSVGTSGSGRHSHSDASNTNTYPGRGRVIEASPTARTYPSTPRQQPKHAPCTDNHGIRPPNPEQYLTPLQQKEVSIRHLRARLRDNVERLQHRDCEIDELRNQLCRMQEDWIEEECHRVEAQLALKEARREIQHLHEVVETVRHNIGSRGEPDPHNHKPYQQPYLGPQAQPVRSRSCGCSPASTLSRSTTYTRLSSDALAMPLGRNGNATLSDPSGAPRAEGRTHLLLEAALLSEQVAPTSHMRGGHPTASVPCSSTYERLCAGGAVLPISHSCHSLSSSCRCSGHACLPHHHLFLHLPQEEIPPMATPAPPPPPPPPPSAPVPVPETKPKVRSQACSPTITWLSEGGLCEELSVISTVHVTEPQPFMTSLSSSPPPQPPYSIEPLPSDTAIEMTGMLPTVAQTCQPQPIAQPSRLEATVVVMEEDDSEATEDASAAREGEEGPPQRSHWSRYFLVDFLALAMPVVPTMAWFCRGAPREAMPVYHIGSLLRGCCAVALHSLRRRGAGWGRESTSMNGTTPI
ncbi:syntaphilin [Aplochiton taeniatus]